MIDTNEKPVYQLRYTLTRDDVAAFELMPRELVGWEKLWLFGPILLCGAAVGLFEDQLRPFLPWDPATMLGQLVSVLGAIAVGYALSLLLLTARARYRIKRTPLPAAPIYIDAFADHVTVKQDGSDQSFAWNDLTVISTASHVILARKPREAIIIPLRAFASPEEMNAFAAFAEVAGRDPQDVSRENDDNNKKEITR